MPETVFCYTMGMLGFLLFAALTVGQEVLAENPTAEQFFSGALDHRKVRITASVRHACFDDIDSRYAFLILQYGNDPLYAAIELDDHKPLKIDNLVGATVRLDGICEPTTCENRQRIGRFLSVHDQGNFHLVTPPKADPYDVPSVDTLFGMRPADISRQGRHRAHGVVIAVCSDRSALIRIASNDVCRASIPDGRLPGYGDVIDAVGYPSTDFYHINLSMSIWRHADRRAEDMSADEPASDTNPTEILHAENGKDIIDPHYHGHAIRLAGTVCGLPSTRDNDNILLIKSETQTIPVDVTSTRSAVSGLEIGSTVSVSGTCVMDVDNWNQQTPFPRIRGYSVAVRTPGDIVVLRRAPWLTPAKLVVVIALLLVLLLAILVWNRSLRNLAERRGRAMLRARLESERSALKKDERTRLAVELHDSLSQNLTGVSMELEVVRNQGASVPRPMMGHLEIAAKALKSCRDELRNCLWDLRSQTLEEPDMTKAVLKTLQPYICDSRLSVRFNVSRSHFSEDTAHALLRIIRELVVNALRHGRATSIKVAGTTDAGTIRCSVTDNGCGFDVSAAPSFQQGHYGLLGIRERIAKLKGTFTLTSGPGRGTKAEITLPDPDVRTD